MVRRREEIGRVRGYFRCAVLELRFSKTFGLLQLLSETLRVSQAPALRAIASYGQSFLTGRRHSKTFGLLGLLPFGQSPF
jgi:hypothetical protein